MRKPLNYYPEKTRITISLTLYQTVRHWQVQIKYGFLYPPRQFQIFQTENRVKWFFINDLTLKCQKRWFNEIQQRSVTPLWDHLRSDEVKLNARLVHTIIDTSFTVLWLLSISESTEIWAILYGLTQHERSISTVSARLSKWLEIKQMYITAALIK